jgi:hypothetical protein
MRMQVDDFRYYHMRHGRSAVSLLLALMFGLGPAIAVLSMQVDAPDKFGGPGPGLGSFLFVVACLTTHPGHWLFWFTLLSRVPILRRVVLAFLIGSLTGTVLLAIVYWPSAQFAIQLLYL